MLASVTELLDKIIMGLDAELRSSEKSVGKYRIEIIICILQELRIDSGTEYSCNILLKNS